MWEFLSCAVTQWYGIVALIVVGLTLFFCLSAIFYRQFFKRFYDVLLSFIAIVCLSPVFLILIIIGSIKMRGNPFFVQPRPGKDNKIFNLLKFRTMSNDRDEKGVLLPDEKRINTYGKMLRATSLDELPELFNILVGHMSIVGPRPQLVRDLVFMSEETKKRHSVRSGLTGLAQVNGRNNITWEEKFTYDLKYVEKISLLGDMKIIFMTIIKVVKKSDVNRDGMETDIDYGDWLLEKGEITKEEYDQKQAFAKRLMA